LQLLAGARMYLTAFSQLDISIIDPQFDAAFAFLFIVELLQFLGQVSHENFVSIVVMVFNPREELLVEL
jgi:hypothetical protein